MKILKKWVTLIYVLFLIMILAFLWTIIINNQNTFKTNLEYNFLNDKLLKNLKVKFDLSYSYHIKNNTDWMWFSDSVNCPSNVSYYSGATLLGTWSTSLFFDEIIHPPSYICSGSIYWKQLNLYYNDTFNSFSWWKLWLDSFQLIWNSISMTWTINTKYVNFSFTGYSKIDWNKNSDDYKNWSTDNISYPNWSEDNDTYARKIIYWYATNLSYSNLFWSNNQINKYIESNTNNLDSNNKLIGKVENWMLYFDIDNGFSWLIIQFNKNIYDNQKKLIKQSQIEFSNQNWAVWYLQNDNTFSTSTTNARILDFKNNDYAIFLKSNNYQNEYIKYKFQIFDKTWSWVYINPIKDDLDKINYLSNDILIFNWWYIYKIEEFFKNKP